MSLRSEFAIWQDELARKKLTIPQRLALWVGPPKPEPITTEPDPYRWWSAAELIAQTQEGSQ